MSLLTLLKKYEIKKAEINASVLERILATSQRIQNAQETLKYFKNYIDDNEFTSPEAEIDFFKRIKQIPQEDLIYEAKIKSFLGSVPIISKAAKLKHCAREMKILNHYCSEQKDLNQYIKMKRTDLDIYYFKRPTNILAFEYNEAFFRDPVFYTSKDLTLSRLKAYQKFSLFLEDEQKALLNDLPSASSSYRITKLTWTSNRTDLTELIYALYHSRTINNGKIDISQITTAFESLFKIELGDVYKTYSDIKNRKRSRTKFLDTLSTTMRSEIDQSDV